MQRSTSFYHFGLHKGLTAKMLYMYTWLNGTSTAGVYGACKTLRRVQQRGGQQQQQQQQQQQVATPTAEPVVI
jgi:hypothetical protein